MNSFILIIILGSFLECCLHHISIYETFIEGVKEGCHYLLTLFPPLMFLTLVISLFQSCGITTLLVSFFKELLIILNIPVDLLVMAFVRPLSGQGAMVLLKRIYESYGIDHVYSLLASIVQTGSDTTLYVVTLYFGSIKEKNYRYSLVLGFFLDFLAFSMMICFYHFGMIS